MCLRQYSGHLAQNALFLTDYYFYYETEIYLRKLTVLICTTL